MAIAKLWLVPSAVNDTLFAFAYRSKDGWHRVEPIWDHVVPRWLDRYLVVKFDKQHQEDIDWHPRWEEV